MLFNIKDQLVCYISFLVILEGILMYHTYAHISLIKDNKNDGLKFFKPCPKYNYKYDNASGSFMCTVPTAKKCYELCQQHGCSDWPFHIPVSPADRITRNNYRCRCFQEYKTCLYNPLSRRQIISD
ncbi:unnamed protein product [Trichobilharzia szidati]|nr:unnamed protein product [Trichobilharzia szidati]